MILTEIDGLSLIESLAAVAIIVVVVTSVGLFFPNATKASFYGAYQNTAKDLAAGIIQQYKESNYNYVPITDPNVPWLPLTVAFPVSGTNNLLPLGLHGACNCNDENPDTMPALPAVVNQNTTYTPRVCINLVDRPTGAANWVSNCPDTPLTSATNKGIKNIRVRVSWSISGVTQTMDLESLVNQ